MTSSPLKISEPYAGCRRVTLDNGPLNLLDPDMISAFGRLIDDLEADDAVKVVVFDSALPDFFMAHYDLLRSAEVDVTPKATGLSTFPDFLLRLERSSFVTIGVLRGRARAAGNELFMGLDMRFASKERARIGQPEIGCGLVPGAGGMERLPLAVNRGRALEIIVGGDDFDADTAALYGWINRALPDSELDAFVDRLARRIASWDKPAIALAKATVNARSRLPVAEELAVTQVRFFEAVQWPDAQKRISKLFERGFQTLGPVELDLNEHIAAL